MASMMLTMKMIMMIFLASFYIFPSLFLGEQERKNLMKSLHLPKED